MPKTTQAHLSKLPDTILPRKTSSIDLKAANGTMVELTASKLNKWFAFIENSSHAEEKNPVSDEIVASQLLSRYGLQNSKDVIKFLKTPAGESVITMIGEKLAEIVLLLESQNQNMLAQLRKEHHSASLFLGFLARKKSAKEKLRNQLTQEQNDKAIRHAHDVANEPVARDTHDNLRKEYEAFAESADQLSTKLNDKFLELEFHNRELLSIHQHGIAIEERYSSLEKCLGELDLFSESHLLAPKRAHQTIKDRISELENTLNTQADAISQAIADNKTTEAQQLMLEHNGLHLQIAGLKDILAILNEEKILYNEDGQKTSSYKDAAFILTPNLKVVKDGAGKYYLIGAKQSLDDLSDVEKARAQTKFDRLKPEISSVKNLVQHNCKLEKEFHGERLLSAERRGQTLQGEIRLLRNQLNLVKAAQANITAELKKQNPDVKKTVHLQHAMPNAPTGASINRTPTLTPQQALKQALVEMHKNPNQQTINNVTTNLTNVFGKVDVSVRQVLNRVIPGRPIPLAVRNSLDRTIFKLKSPTELPDPTYDSTPSPFKTKPTPFSR